MPLGDCADPIRESIAHPPQFPTEDPDPVRTKHFHNQRNLRASPAEFAVAGSESIPFKLRWKNHRFLSASVSHAG